MHAWNKGIKTGPQSEETKRRIGAGNAGKKRTPEVCDAISSRMKEWYANNQHPMLGNHHTIESNELNRLAHLGKKSNRKDMTLEEIYGEDRATKMKQDMSERMKGMHFGTETEFKKGNMPWNKDTSGCFTDETIKKMSTSRIEYMKKHRIDDLGVCIGKHESVILDKLEHFIGYKIIRQHQVLQYFLDGYCAELNLAIEIDEPKHLQQIESDELREHNIINEIGCTFLRIPVPN